MKKTNKAFLQCGYEDRCKKKDCLKCRKHLKHDPKKLGKLNFTIAEEIAMEDFGVCDLKGYTEEELDLCQKLIYRALKKIWDCEIE